MFAKSLLNTNKIRLPYFQGVNMTNFSSLKVDEGIANSRGWHVAPWGQRIRSFAELIGWSGDFLSVAIFSLSGLQLSVWLFTHAWFASLDDFIRALLA